MVANLTGSTTRPDHHGECRGAGVPVHPQSEPMDYAAGASGFPVRTAGYRTIVNDKTGWLGKRLHCGDPDGKTLLVLTSGTTASSTPPASKTRRIHL